MKKTLQVSNGVAFISTVYINYLSNTGLLNNTNIGDVSRDLNNLFTPAGYAFAIWGLIYMLLFGFIIYQGRSLFVKVRDDSFILKIGWWFVISCVANSAWVLCWIYEYTGASLACMSLILISLLTIIQKNKMALWDAPISVIVFIWWPFVIYAGWITVASIANMSAFLTKISWNGWGISETIWTILLIFVAGLINLFMTWKYNLREYALVGVWALIAIAVANWDSNAGVKISAIAIAIILLLSSFMHSFRKDAISPFTKLIEHFKK